jgi:tetratricopeptide (TPR) repeat protein
MAKNGLPFANGRSQTMFSGLMKFWIGNFAALGVLVTIVNAIGAEDPSIDRLLHKLPPPEKIVQPGAQSDPAGADPMAKEMFAAAKARKMERALILSRRLSQRYPTSSGASFIHGLFALSQERFQEAEAAYRNAIANEPKSAIAYVGLGASEAGQQHYAEALSTFKKVTRMEPKAEVGWIAASGCASKLGRRQESVAYAKSATEIAPNSFAAWSQLATAQRELGDNRAAAKSQAKANQLRKSAGKRSR